MLNTTDENIHALAGAWSFKYKLNKYNQANKGFEDFKKLEIQEKVHTLAKLIYEHECEIIKMMFEKGKIDGITPHQLENFVQSRINICLSELGLEKLYEVKYNPIASHFYKGINDYQFVDFFSGTGREYNREWSETDFVWHKE